MGTLTRTVRNLSVQYKFVLLCIYKKFYKDNDFTESAVCNNWPTSGGTATNTVPPVIVTPEDTHNWTGPQPGPNMPIQDVIKSLINFLASRYVH